MLRRLISTSVEENWSGLDEQIKVTVKVELLAAVQQEEDHSIRKKITDVIAELARFLIGMVALSVQCCCCCCYVLNIVAWMIADEEGVNKWPEVLTFLFELSSSPNVYLREAALNIFT